MPVTILLAILLSGVFVLAWIVAGAFFLWGGDAFPSPANTASTAGWITMILLGLALNLAIFFGIFRRANWARWLVVMQALVLTVVLSAVASPGVWGILAVALQTVLVSVPASNRWFDAAPSPQRTLPNTP